MKIIFFTKYSRLGASSRLRTFQYIPYYKALNYYCVITSFFNEQYLIEIYNKKKINKLNILRSYINRIFKLFTIYKYDVIIIEKELFPYFPPIAEFLLKTWGIKHIVDFDDAIFHNYDLHPNPFIRKILGQKIYSIINGANTVVAGNDYLALKAKEAGSKRTVIIPTVVDTNRYSIKEKKKSGKFVIGWIGSPSTLKYVKMISPVLHQISSSYDVVIHLVGVKGGINLENQEIIEWSEETEITSIQNFDVGIMPLCDSPWEKGKCGYKLIQYMACGLPVVGSPIGVNNKLIKNGINGYKASTGEEWKSALEKLINSPELRTKMGLFGRRLVEEKYSLQKTSLSWVREIQNVYDKN